MFPPDVSTTCESKNCSIAESFARGDVEKRLFGGRDDGSGGRDDVCSEDAGLVEEGSKGRIEDPREEGVSMTDCWREADCSMADKMAPPSITLSVVSSFRRATTTAAVAILLLNTILGLDQPWPCGLVKPMN